MRTARYLVAGRDGDHVRLEPLPGQEDLRPLLLPREWVAGRETDGDVVAARLRAPGLVELEVDEEATAQHAAFLLARERGHGRVGAEEPQPAAPTLEPDHGGTTGGAFERAHGLADEE